MSSTPFVPEVGKTYRWTVCGNTDAWCCGSGPEGFKVTDVELRAGWAGPTPVYDFGILLSNGEEEDASTEDVLEWEELPA